MLSRHMLTVVVKVNGQKVDADNKDADELTMDIFQFLDLPTEHGVAGECN